MADFDDLFLYEEVMLLAIKDEEGTFSAGYVEYAVIGAVLAELILEKRLSVDETKEKLVTLESADSMGDPILDQCLEMIHQEEKTQSLSTWITKLSAIKELRHQVARQLCDRGILRADEGKVLFIFSRRIYPEVNRVPEQEIIDRIRQAILGDGEVDPRTSILISLASSIGLLAHNIAQKELKKRKDRIEQISKGELAGAAAKELIAAAEAAMMTTIMVTTIATTTASAANN